MDPGSIESRETEPRDWPGERNPDQWDVHDAHQVPEVPFLQRFKAALLLSDDAEGCRQYLTSTSCRNAPNNVTEDATTSVDTRTYTYPMAILSELPLLPSTDILSRAQCQFSSTFKRHIYWNAIEFPLPSSDHFAPPYLHISFACLALATSSSLSPVQDLFASVNVTAMDLLVGGHKLWGVTMEVDNREARMLESVMAGNLYATYAMLTADKATCGLSTIIVAGTATMARRMRMHCKEPLTPVRTIFVENNAATTRLLTSYMFLLDVVRAVHCGGVPCISSKELFMQMPSSPYSFHQLYATLMSDTTSLPADTTTNEDALLLLIGICADVLFDQHSFSAVALQSKAPGTETSLNPYAPLSPASEMLHLYHIYEAALRRWQQHFGTAVSNDVFAMFCYCKLLLAFPGVLKLPSIVGFLSGTSNMSTPITQIDVGAAPDDAIDMAWQILDNVHAESETLEVNVSIWLPVILFQAALTIWYHLKLQDSSSAPRIGTVRALTMFKDELIRLPWPCCIEMSRVLDTLMRSSATDTAHPERSTRRAL